MKRFLTLLALGGFAALLCAGENGFDQFGYNDKARLFVGAYDGYDRVWGNDGIYANDHLVMKWSKAWDDARFNHAPWGPDAWVDNEIIGVHADGSGYTEHAKIIWVGSELENSPYWRDGGSPIWGQFELIMDQGMDPNQEHYSLRAVPNGYGR